MNRNEYEYPTIRAWHASSYKYYKDAMVKLARETGAPHNATHPIFDDQDRVTGWSTTDDVTDFDTRADTSAVRAALEDK